MAAHLYTTEDDTEVGNEKSTYLLGLSTSLKGGSDIYESCCGAIKATNGLYVEVLEDGAGSDSDTALLTVSYVPALDYVEAYPKVGAWRAHYWNKAAGRAGTRFGDNYYTEITMTDSSDDAADGTVDSGAGGGKLEVDSTRTFLTDEMLSTIRTGLKDS